MLSTMIMFGIIQGLHIVREDEEEKIEKRKKRKGSRDMAWEEQQPERRRREPPRFEEVPRQRTGKNKDRVRNREFAWITYFLSSFYCNDGIHHLLCRVPR